MLCESWRETLTDAALRGHRLPREAQAHLEACGTCRSAFEAEQRLFGLIDDGLDAVLNTELPASLVPGVRAMIASASERSVRQLPASAFMAAAAALAGILLLIANRPRPSVAPSPPATGYAAPSEIVVAPNEVTPRLPVAAPSSRSPLRKEVVTVRHVASHSDTEVLVLSEEEANLQRYLRRLQARLSVQAKPVVVTTDAPLAMSALEIPEIDMPQLTIKPLENGDSE